MPTVEARPTQPMGGEVFHMNAKRCEMQSSGGSHVMEATGTKWNEIRCASWAWGGPEMECKLTTAE